MSSPTSVDFLPRRLESIAVSPSPKKKRIKTIPAPQPSFAVDPNLQNLPSVLIAKVLVFLVPNISHPVNSECGLINLAQVSKHYRALALDVVAWKHICNARWKTKVDFASRMARADVEAMAEADADDPDKLIKGSYWYRKFGIEERDAARTTITRDELYDTTFSVRLWFHAPSYPPNIKKVKGIVPSGLDGHSISDMLQFHPNGTVTGLPEQYKDRGIYELNKEGSTINVGCGSLEQGTHHRYSHHVHRRKDWGWELRSQVFAVRSLTCEDDIDKLWSDYASNLVVEYRKKGVVCTRSRGGKKYTRREVPDNRAIMKFLVW